MAKHIEVTKEEFIASKPIHEGDFDAVYGKPSKGTRKAYNTGFVIMNEKGVTHFLYQYKTTLSKNV